MIGRGGWWLVCVFLLCGAEAHAAPESWLWFGASTEGTEAGGRFGAEVDCSGVALYSGSRSIVAVGAPNVMGGKGRVYLYDPLQVSTPLQVLDPVVSSAAKRFGAAIQFIDDINGDGVEDLLIGAPGEGGPDTGGVYAHTSTVTSNSVHYTPCGGVEGPVGFGQKIQGLRALGEATSSNVVIANPRSGRIDSFLVSAQESGLCQFTATSDFSEARSISSQFGASLTQRASPASGRVNAAEIVVAAPAEGAAGVIYERSAAEISPLALPLTPITIAERPGSVVSGHHTSTSYVVGVPRLDGARGSAMVYGADAAGGVPHCVISNPAGELSGIFGSNVQHLGDSFLAFFAAAQEVVVVRSAESATGGALSLVGVMEDGCVAPLPVNNCQLDPLQEQGTALSGGPRCQVYLNGRLQRMLLSGSPGWSGGRGRVDIAFDEGVLDIPLSCPDDELAPPVATPTPSPQGTATESPPATGTTTPTTVVTGSPSLIETESPTPTPSATATLSSTLAPFISATPTSTHTSSATATRSAEAATPVVGQDGAIGAGPSLTPTAVPQVVTPIVVAPGLGGLPAPVVVVTEGEVRVQMPVVKPQLSVEEQAKVIRQLQRKRGLSRNKAAQLLSDPDNLVVTYILRVTEIPASRRFSFIQSAHAQDVGRRANKTRQIRSRFNTVTLRNLRPGAILKASYVVEVSLKKPRSVLGATQPSAERTFQAL
jgi:hypothetical protein